jgi:peptide/nickel transport system permease protein
MTGYVLRRLAATAAAVVVTSMILFAVLRILPGDPIAVLVGESQADVSADVVRRLRAEHGLDEPLHVQYAVWASRLLTGDLGRSIRNRQPVRDVLVPRVWPTVQIGLLAAVIAIAIALPVGVLSAIRPNTWKDWCGTLGALAGAAMPYFLLGGVLIYVVAVRFRWLPASGYVSPWVDPVQSLQRSVMPALTLGLSLAAVTTRQTRSSLVEVLHQPYVTTARAKGLTERRVVLRHALKNALLPVVTTLGVYLGTVFGGAVITETIFAVPGLGRLLVEAILSRDYAVVQAVVLLITLAVILANLAVDLLYGCLDPRIRLG